MQCRGAGTRKGGPKAALLAYFWKDDLFTGPVRDPAPQADQFWRNISWSGSFGTRLATGIALPKPSRL